MKELEKLLEEHSDHFTHRYGQFAPETSTRSRLDTHNIGGPRRCPCCRNFRPKASANRGSKAMCWVGPGCSIRARHNFLLALPQPNLRPTVRMRLPCCTLNPR